MRFAEALRTVQRAPEGAPPWQAALACGFTPLHVQTFLGAYLQERLPDRRIEVIPGIYGDVAGTLEGLQSVAADGIALALEWPDLDPRLGYRSAGRWGPAALGDILLSSRASLDRIANAIERLHGVPVAVCLPTLPLPPIFHTPGWQYAHTEVELRKSVLDFASRLLRRVGCSLASPSELEIVSPPAGRLDLKAEFSAGLPYTLAHAEAVAAALARLLAPPAPKKGLITDLDDTLWRGLAGEIGPDRICWDLANHSQAHGLYQKLLASLAEEGVLIGVATKNDPAIVRQALAREDILLPAGSVFPIETHWGAKSGSVSRILQAWNISADSVVFVDDSSMELAEVAAEHPGIECVPFPSDDRAVCAMLHRLRDLFGRPRLGGEDAIRLESIRKGAAFREAADGAASEAFLQGAEAVIRVDFSLSTADPRTLELVNKTNQFNLNGIRRTEAEWSRLLTRPGAFLACVSYKDKFGPLGRIAVAQGLQTGAELHVETWVMSCRAFSRRIEHQSLKALFDRYAARAVSFDFAPTAKNGPLREFFSGIAGQPPDGPFGFSRAAFERACPPLYHRTVESLASSNQWTELQTA